MRAEAGPPRLPASALLRYALASTGGVIGYTPLLTLLLPIKLQAFAPDERYALLVACSVAGAVAAGFANIAFGWLGDRSVARGHGRRSWMVLGLIATAASFAGVVEAERATAVIVAVVAFQIAINAFLAQVSALIADEVPFAQKNTAAALLTLGAPLAAGASALVVVLAEREGARLALVTALMVACAAPLLFTRERRAGAIEAAPTSEVAAQPVTAPRARRLLATAWATRLLVQVANSGVNLCLFFYFARILGDPARTTSIVAQLLLVASLIPVPLALLLGRWSDRVGRREWFLGATAVVASLGLAGMALTHDWFAAAVCFVIFATAVAVFQALNIGHAMLLLPRGAGAGRDLGVLNLANTLPQVLAPLLALSVTANDFSSVLVLFALLTLAAALLPAAQTVVLRKERRAPSFRG